MTISPTISAANAAFSQKEERNHQPQSHLQSPQTPRQQAPPPSFLCPLSHQVMQEPVMDHDGHNFEYHSILNWIRGGHFMCPVSQKPLHLSDLTPNATLHETIHRWLDKRGGVLASQNDAKQASVIDDNYRRMDDTVDNDDHPDNKKWKRQPKDDQEGQDRFATCCFEDAAELGEAIASLSVVLSAKEGYMIAQDDVNSSSFECRDAEEEELVLGGLPERDGVSSSLLLNMFLPQEREALARVRTRARERERAERWTRFVWAIVGLTLVLVFILLAIFLAGLIRTQQWQKS